MHSISDALPHFDDCLDADANQFLDLGDDQHYVLQRNKAKGYNYVAVPMEEEGTVVIRTGECSGQFVLQISQRMKIEETYSDETVSQIEDTLRTVNGILVQTK